MSMDGLNTGFAGAKTCKPLSRKKCIFRDAQEFKPSIDYWVKALQANRESRLLSLYRLFY